MSFTVVTDGSGGKTHQLSWNQNLSFLQLFTYLEVEPGLLFSNDQPGLTYKGDQEIPNDLIHGEIFTVANTKKDQIQYTKS